MKRIARLHSTLCDPLAWSALSITFSLMLLPAQGGLHAQTLEPNFSDALVMGGWSEPVGATWDANGRTYVWEKRGRVWIIENGVRLAQPLIDIQPEVGNWRDHGFLGFALDPQFTTNGRIYMMYAVDRHHLMNFGTGSYNAATNEYYAATIMRITRYTAIGPSFNTVDPASRVVLLGETRQTGVPLLHESHSTGSLMFGTDGTLLATVGDGASYGSTDVGSASETYWSQALTDGIIRTAENVGALRSQMVTSYNGKVLRLDPETGNGLPSNPWYDATAPRSAKSRSWALGLRNPYRATIHPGSGSTDPAAGDPGTLYIGDVGWNTWEDLNVCYEGGMNFGWPIFEGMDLQTSYGNTQAVNMDEPNPQYNGITCTQQFFRFIDLLKQDTPIHLNAHPNPCNTEVQIPNSAVKHFHSRPAIDWRHGSQSRSAGFSGSTAVSFDLNAPGAPVPGPLFGGFAAIAGPHMAGQNMPAGYQNSSFHGDYAGGWIRRFKFDANDRPVSVHDFATGLGAVTWIGGGPDGCVWYMKYNSNEIRRICYTLAVNLPPVAVAQQNVQFGPGPLTVQFTGSNSSDPENGALSYLWNYGDGSTSTQANGSHVFSAPPGIPTSYNVTLTVTDNLGQSAVSQLLVSVNNTPPAVQITSFQNGGTYPIGVDTTYLLQANVVDLEHPAGQLTYAWRTTFHHNTHTHPEPIDATPSTSTVISGVGCDGETYYYNISLTVTDAGGLSTKVEHLLFPRCQAIAPTAIISASVSAGQSPLVVNLSGTSSYDPGTIVGYHWDLGDGTSSTLASPVKTFTESGDHYVTLTVTDNDGLTGQVAKVITVVTLDPPQCVGATGSVLREYFAGIAGTTVADLVNSPNYPNNPTSTSFPTSFQVGTSVQSNFGTRMRGYIIAPTTGTYVFTATSDDASVVYLSPNADPLLKQIICNVPGWTEETEYTKYSSQTSAPIQLVAGKYYYVEMLQKEASGGDHLALRWQTPTNGNRVVIPGSALARWQNCLPSVVVRTQLQGCWDPTTALMRSDLRTAGLVPASEPYTAQGYVHVGGGGEVAGAGVLAQTGKNEVVDWVVVELRNKLTPNVVVATRSALLQRDGDVVGTDGYARLLFNVPVDQYYVAVRHRNHLGVMSSQPLVFGPEPAGLDLTLGSQSTYGVEARVTLSNGKRAMWSGNVVADDALRYTGQANDRDPILQAIGGTTPTTTVNGYLNADVNLDGVVKYTGQWNDRDPVLSNIGGTVPTNIRDEQLP